MQRERGKTRTGKKDLTQRARRKDGGHREGNEDMNTELMDKRIAARGSVFNFGRSTPEAILP
jgi:hypothetical protein